MTGVKKKIRKPARVAKSASVRVAGTEDELALHAAGKTRTLAKMTGERLKAAGIKLVDLRKS